MKNFFKISSQNGFSYVDVIIAIFILMVGILAMLSALTANILRLSETEKRIVAKQIALSTIESIISAKEISREGVIEGWDAVGNIGSNVIDGEAKGIFSNGWNPIRTEMGWDGVAGTVDDTCAGEGGCAVEGRPANNSPVISGFEREIVITDVHDPERPSPPNPVSRRRIDVNIRYFINQARRRETVSTLITNYKKLDFEDEEN
jgi:type II secretory pathway pseudopilin PulG